MNKEDLDLELLGFMERLIPLDVVDFILFEPILYLCTCGISNEEINRYILEVYEADLSLKSISYICQKFLSFSGWSENLNFSPYFYYIKARKDFGKYNELISPLTDSEDYVIISYDVCREYDKQFEKANSYE